MPHDPLADDEEPQAMQPSVSVLRRLAEQGLTDSEIAARVGMDVDAVRASPDVQVDLGPAHDARVTRALYERAVGTETWAETQDKLGSVRRLYSRVLPDTAAGKQWLQARNPEQWGERRHDALQVVVVRVLGHESARSVIEIEPEPQPE